jgi:hypothetical protein
LQSSNIDLSRRELRFFVILPFLGYFLEKLSERLTRINFSSNPIVQTIYLGNEEQIVPWGISLKARRYLPDFSLLPNLDPNQPFLFERKEKSVECWLSREKKRGDSSLGEIISSASSDFSITLEPYLLLEYRRRHFVPKEDIPLRLTVDVGMRYWLTAGGNPQLMRIDQEISRIEIKVAESHINHEIMGFILKLLFDLGAQPIISKKKEGLNLAKRLYDISHAQSFVKELDNLEIEAKLVLEEADPVSFFTKLKEWLGQGRAPLVLSSHYPNTFTTGSLNHYWAITQEEKLADSLKILFKGSSFKTVAKGIVSVVDPELAIVRRSEHKGKRIQYTPEVFREVISSFEGTAGQLRYVGYLNRSRKAVWPESEGTGRVYHVSLDRCLAEKRPPLYQLEVEYSGIYKVRYRGKSDRTESDIICDTQMITSSILDFAIQNGYQLKPNILSKFDWLMGSVSHK